MDLVAVAAVAENGVIGDDGDIPWSRPEDRRQYRARVADSPVVLGRKTFEDMRDDLPGATQLVLTTQDRTYDEPSVTVVDSVDAALTHLETVDADTAYVLGGGAIYEAFFPHLDALLISRIPLTPPGDTYFPAIDADTWTLETVDDYETFTLEHWTRTDDNTQ